MKIISVVGARPNFMKVAPLDRVFRNSGQVESIIVHTGQHYDERMSKIFFEQLALPEPKYYLGINNRSSVQLVAEIMLKFEEIVQQEQPDLILVVGDVNSTLACALVANKMQIRLVHVEAGLRSSDRGMPEENNRILTDHISNLLFVTEESGLQNLAREGVSPTRVKMVGNVMIDSLAFYQKKLSELPVLYPPKSYALMTMHRPANVDNEAGLKKITTIIETIGQHTPIVLPLHPRTAHRLQKYGLLQKLEQLTTLHILPPQGYLEFLQLMKNATLVITDSGGIQEETTYLQIPCITLRDSTERPITVTLGTNHLVPNLDVQKTEQIVLDILAGKTKSASIPPLWDGKA
ncbi:MAG: non-hydrolyzing UDP-N-acetylglucosamine 2-epimerase, partial [Saprospiraceae bacterium]